MVTMRYCKVNMALADCHQQSRSTRDFGGPKNLSIFKKLLARDRFIAFTEDGEFALLVCTGS